MKTRRYIFKDHYNEHSGQLDFYRISKYKTLFNNEWFEAPSKVALMQQIKWIVGYGTPENPLNQIQVDQIQFDNMPKKIFMGGRIKVRGSGSSCVCEGISIKREKVKFERSTISVNACNNSLLLQTFNGYSTGPREFVRCWLSDNIFYMSEIMKDTVFHLYF
jgi:hypothetical protein